MRRSQSEKKENLFDGSVIRVIVRVILCVKKFGVIEIVHQQSAIRNFFTFYCLLFTLILNYEIIHQQLSILTDFLVLSSYFLLWPRHIR